jgi:hypothetical protein
MKRIPESACVRKATALCSLLLSMRRWGFAYRGKTTCDVLALEPLFNEYPFAIYIFHQKTSSTSFDRLSRFLKCQHLPHHGFGESDFLHSPDYGLSSSNGMLSLLPENNTDPPSRGASKLFAYDSK